MIWRGVYSGAPELFLVRAFAKPDTLSRLAQGETLRKATSPEIRKKLGLKSVEAK
jgi:hypothetical protein